jgi:penicillin V acylase-like amidase (Ntn superfamily)
MIKPTTMKSKILFAMTLCVLVFQSETIACTVFRMKATSGNITLGRSMEFGVDLKYDSSWCHETLLSRALRL